MAQITWKAGTSGLWQTAADWVGGVLPGVGDDALLTATGSFTATSTSFVEIHSVQLSARATLDINSGGFRLDAGTGTGANAGTIRIDNGNQLTIGGNVVNSGTILLNSIGNTTQITISSPSVTLSGGGSVVMSASGANYIDGNNPGFKLINVDNTISGGGNLGNNDLTIVNQAAGTIDANTVATLNVQTQNLLTNAGLMEATAGGTMQIISTGVVNAGGMLVADGGTVDLNNTTVFGGKVQTLHGGVLQTFNGNGALDGLTFGAVTLNGRLTVNNATNLYLAGQINDAGSTLALASTVNTTQIFINSAFVTLSGGGAIVMSNSNSNYIQSNIGFQAQLINVDNTISGTGNLGNGNLTFVNGKKGVVNASNAAVTGSSTGVLNLNANGGVSNAGLLEATGTGGLVITNTNVYQASTGIIEAKGNGTHVDLNSSNIVGGKLVATGTGVIQTVSGTSQLDGLTSGAITNAGKLVINNATNLNVVGVLNNMGSIAETSTGSTTEFRLNSWTVTLQGGGTLTLSDNANNYILSVFNNYQTLNNVDNTISGAGNIGNGGMQFINGGTVSATGTAQLQINLGFAQSGVNNAGALWEATGTGGLLLTNGLFTNNGTVEALNNSSVTYSSSAANLNLANGVLTGGTWKALAAGSGTATVSLSGGNITTDAATIVLSGTGSVFQAGNGSTFATIETTLTTIAAGGSLSLLGGRAYTTTLGLTDSGTLTLGAATLTAASVTVGTGGVLSGRGTVAAGVTNGGSLTATGGLLDVTKILAGSGTATIATGSTLQVDGALTEKSVVFAAGGTKEVLALGKASAATSTITGWGKGDTIDLLNVPVVTKLSYSGTTTSGILTVTAGSTTVASLHFSGKYTTASFSQVSDGHTGTNIVATGLALTADLTSVGGFNTAALAAPSPSTLPDVGGASPYAPNAMDTLFAHHS